MAEYQRSRREEERPFEAALLVCGRKDKYQMADEVRDMFEGLEEAPVMVVGYSTHEAMQMIHDYTPKLNIDDKNRVRKAVEHYEPYIDFEQLLQRASSKEWGFSRSTNVNAGLMTDAAFYWPSGAVALISNGNTSLIEKLL